MSSSHPEIKSFPIIGEKLEALKGGDRTAWQELIDLVKPGLVEFAKKKLRLRDEDAENYADEIINVQYIWIRGGMLVDKKKKVAATDSPAVEKVRRGEPREKVALNELKPGHFFGKMWFSFLESLRAGERASSNSEALLDKILNSRELSPVDECQIREHRELVEMLLKTLTPFELNVLSMRYDEDLSLKEIGARIGRHPANVGRLIASIFERFRNTLGDGFSI